MGAMGARAGDEARFQGPTGIRGYFEKIRLFSRNARLYLLHVIGMDLIHGTWEVLFNLYLLELGFSVQFIGLRLAIMGIAGAVAAVPMGRLSDRVGRKAGFIIGDGGGALMSLIQIMSVNPVVLLVTPAPAGVFGSLHYVTEQPFMAENSERRERVHLFSVAGGLRTLAMMGGSLVAGFLPLWAVGQFGVDKVAAYRWAAFIGIAWWLLSLIPAVLLRPYVSAEEAAAMRESADGRRQVGGGGLQALLANVRNPVLVSQLLLINALLALGAGFVVPLFNVFFHEGAHAHEHQIGTTFAAGALFLALASFLAPFASERLGKVPAVFSLRLLSVPFILLIGLAPQLATPATVVSLAGVAYVLRTTLYNMANPVAEAFTMEVLHPAERATVTGLGTMVGRIMAALAGLVGAQLMNGGDYRTPFFLMAAAVAASTVLFWRCFRGLEAPAPAPATAVAD